AGRGHAGLCVAARGPRGPRRDVVVDSAWQPAGELVPPDTAAFRVGWSAAPSGRPVERPLVDAERLRARTVRAVLAALEGRVSEPWNPRRLADSAGLS